MDAEKKTSAYLQIVIVQLPEYVHVVHHAIAVQTENKLKLGTVDLRYDTSRNFQQVHAVIVLKFAHKEDERFF